MTNRITIAEMATLPDLKVGYVAFEVILDNDPHNIKLRTLKAEFKESEHPDQLYARNENRVPVMTLWLAECTDNSTRQYLSNEFLRPTPCSVYFYDLLGNVVDSHHMTVVGKVSHLIMPESGQPHPLLMYRCEYAEVE